MKELAAAGITDMVRANAYLRQHYLPAFNAEFARPSSGGGVSLCCQSGGLEAAATVSALGTRPGRSVHNRTDYVLQNRTVLFAINTARKVGEAIKQGGCIAV